MNKSTQLKIALTGLAASVSPAVFAAQTIDTAGIMEWFTAAGVAMGVVGAGVIAFYAIPAAYRLIRKMF